MLHYIRDRAQGWIAWFIVGLISIPFALWGINSYFNGPAEVVAAEVNGKSISQTELQQAVQRYRDQMRNMLGERFDPAMFEGEMVKRQVLDGLIEQQLLQEASQSIGQTISDADISAVIRNTPAFQREGKFDSEYYAMVLARAGYTPVRYENQLRSDLLMQQLTKSIEDTGLATTQQVNQLLQIEKQQRTFAYGVIPAADFSKEVEIDDQAVQSYYDLNKSAYMTPERVKVNYIELSEAALAKTIAVNDTELKQFYSENPEQFYGPEQRRASHILIEGDDDAALAKINEIKAKLDAGEDFATLAKTTSQDTGSAEQGGDLGLFQKGVMDPAFEEAAFALKNVGDVSEPVKTEFGYHLIKLTEIKKADAKPFEEVKDEVATVYRQREAEKVFYDKAEQLANLTYENPDSLDVAAEELGLEIKTTENFSRQGTESGLTSEAKFIEAAFGTDVLQERLNSSVIELSETDLVVVHINEHTPSSLLPLESVAPAIREQLKFEKASDLAKQNGQQLMARVNAGESAETVFTNWTAEAQHGRDSQGISAQVIEHAFAMPHPADKPVYDGFTASNGNYIVVELSEVTDGDIGEVSEDDKVMLKGQLARAYANSEAQAFITALKADADINIRNEALK